LNTGNSYITQEEWDLIRQCFFTILTSNKTIAEKKEMIQDIRYFIKNNERDYRYATILRDKYHIDPYRDGILKIIEIYTRTRFYFYVCKNSYCANYTLQIKNFLKNNYNYQLSSLGIALREHIKNYLKEKNNPMHFENIRNLSNRINIIKQARKFFQLNNDSEYNTYEVGDFDGLNG